jgi:hypothetical protein
VTINIPPEALEELRKFGEQLTFEMRHYALNTPSKEIETVTTEDQLLSVIAAAQAKLDAIRRLPQEEPHSNEKVLAYRFVTNITRNGFTYLALRLPGDNDLRSWYITAGNRASVKNPMTWNELIEFMTLRSVTSFESLYTRTEWTDMHLEDNE